MNSVAVYRECCGWTRVRVDQAGLGQCEHGRYPDRINFLEWRVRCPNCRYGRWCGQDRGDALRRQQAHVDKYPWHRPSVAYDRVTLDGRGTVLNWEPGNHRRNPVLQSGHSDTDGDVPF